jgi:glycosyltransferase involved in cell wall biosynthesis
LQQGASWGEICMRIGFFSTEYFRKHSGMAESDRELCWELARIGYDVRALVEDRAVQPGELVVSRDGPVRVWRYQAPRFHPLRPRSYADKVVKAVLGPPRLASALALYRRFMRENADVDLLQVEAPFPEGTLAAIVARRARKPFLVSPRGWESLDFSWLRYQAIRWTLHRATAVRPNALNMGRIVVEQFGVDPRRVRVIRTNLSRETYLPEGTDLAAFRRESRAAVRARTGLGHRFLLVAAARFVPAKGLEHLLAALRILRDRDLNGGLVLCGDGILRERLRTRVAELDLTKDVAFAGSVPHAEIRSILGGVDLLVIPALLDWTPRVAVEAAAVGTPVVLTSAVGCAPWMAEAGAGKVVPPASPEPLADAIRAWLEDSEGWTRASGAAVAWAATFAVEEVAKEIARFHRDVITGYQAA